MFLKAILLLVILFNKFYIDILTLNFGFLMNQGARVGIYFINMPEWLIVDHACSAYSFISVPLYDTLGV